MDVVLNEKNKALEIIKTKNIHKNIWETKKLLIKYYHSQGLHEEQIRIQLEDFLDKNVKIVNGKEYNLVKDMDNIEKAIKTFTKPEHKIVEFEDIKISKLELKKIKSINNKSLEKLAFILLIICKIDNMKNNRFTEWVNDKTKEFYKYTNNREWGDNQEIMIHKLFKLGIVDFPSEFGVNKTGIKLLYIDEKIKDKDVEMRVYDFRNIVLEYLKWCGDKIIECEECGIRVEQKNNRMKYCNSCWKEKHQEQKNKWKREIWNKRQKEEV